MKVSVIVPVYKVEDCLARCLDSLCGQSLRDIEIILIEDASPDSCGKICDQYAMRDERFKVIHCNENRGLSEVRNTGIKMAVADYLMFVDSDDWVHKDFCKEAYECAVRYKAELVMFGFQRVAHKKAFVNSTNVEFNKENKALLKRGYKTQREALELLQCSSVGAAPWNKIYHKSIFDNISYPAGRFYEGTGTTYKTVLKASRIYYLDIVLYYYCFRAGSITTLKTKKALEDLFEMKIQQYHDLVEWQGCSWEKLEMYLYNTVMTYCIRKKRDLSDPNYMYCLNVVRSCKGIPNSFKFKRKVLFVLLKYFPKLFELICSFSGKKYTELLM